MTGRKQVFYRFPFSALERFFPEKLATFEHLNGSPAQVVTPLAQIADMSGWDKGYLHRLRDQGLSEVSADRLAIACGLHPATVWGDAWWWTAPVPEPEPGGKFCGRHPQHKEREAA